MIKRHDGAITLHCDAAECEARTQPFSGGRPDIVRMGAAACGWAPLFPRGPGEPADLCPACAHKAFAREEPVAMKTCAAGPDLVHVTIRSSLGGGPCPG